MENIIKKVRELHELLKGTSYHIRINSSYLQVTVGDHCKRKNAIERFKQHVEKYGFISISGDKIEENSAYIALLESIEDKEPKKKREYINFTRGLTKTFNKEEENG